MTYRRDNDCRPDIDKKQWAGKFFITGIDTDAGKSYATGWLARHINESGGNSITMKFVQTGNKDFSEDIQVHRHIMGSEILSVDKLHITAPEIFSYPCSPDLAARIDGREINLELITEASDELAREFETVLIEGAGGLMVPLKKDTRDKRSPRINQPYSSCIGRNQERKYGIARRYLQLLFRQR